MPRKSTDSESKSGRSLFLRGIDRELISEFKDCLRRRHDNAPMNAVITRLLRDFIARSEDAAAGAGSSDS
jgi:hypothetical protein